MEESTYFDSQFLRFQFMVSYCMALGPVTRQHISMGIVSPHGCQEAKKREKKSQGPKTLSKGTLPVT